MAPTKLAPLQDTSVSTLGTSTSASSSKKRALDDSPTKPSSSVNGPKRAKVHLIVPPPVAEYPKATTTETVELTEDDDDESDDDDDEDEEEEDEKEPPQNDEIPEDVKDRLDHASALVESLSKGYLKDVMDGLDGFYGSRGTNSEMAEAITDHLEEAARNGSDLVRESRLIQEVHRDCWGGCAYEDY